MRGRRAGRVTGVVGLVLVALLGFGFVTQQRSTATGDNLATLRADDLVQILDGLQRREDDLNAEIREQEDTLRALEEGGASSGQALAAARKQATELAILAGTAPATGPGVELQIGDSAGGVGPELMVDVLQELRNAGAEVVQIGPVRVGVDSAFTGSGRDLVLDGTALGRPIRVLAIGDPATLAAAMAIPGGVVDSVRRVGGTIDVTQSRAVRVTALRSVRTPNYARPAG